MKIKRPEMFNISEKDGESKLWRQILSFIAVFLIGSMVGTIPVLIVSFKDTIELAMSGVSQEEMQVLLEQLAGSRTYICASLFGTIFSIIATILYACKIEKRSLRSFGFVRKNAFRDYLVGILVGFVMFSLVVGLNVVTGSMTVSVATENFSMATLGFILVFFIGFLFQGAYEEILVRGYFMVNIGAKHKVITAVIISSIAFAIMHGGNSGIALLPLINLVLIAVFFGLYIICFNNIWGACAIHSIWNFVQGNFYGIKVSGINIEDSIFVSTNIPGKELINGGAFGAEGGIATTIVTIFSIIILLIYMKKRGKIENKTTENVENN